MVNLRVVLCTVPSSEVAERLAKLFVNENLAACVNILPAVRSIYRWEGAVQDDSEHLLVIKTRDEALHALAGRIEQEHPYQVPEIVALEPTFVNEAYAKWVEGSVRAKP